jgi:hypothetical protein
MVNLRLIFIFIILGVSAVFAFTGNMFLGDYTRVFVAVGCVFAGVLLYFMANETYPVPAGKETIDSQRRLKNQLEAEQTRAPLQAAPVPNIKDELNKIDTKFAELHKEEHIQDIGEKPVMEHLKELVEEATNKPVTEMSLAKQRQAELRTAKKKKEEDPFRKFKE